MRTEQKIFNDLIETIVNNSENNEAKITNVELWAKSWKEEMKQALTLTDVVKSSLDLKFINLLDGELCDYKVINKICNRQDDAQDVLRKVVKEHYKIDM